MMSYQREDETLGGGFAFFETSFTDPADMTDTNDILNIHTDELCEFRHTEQPQIHPEIQNQEQDQYQEPFTEREMEREMEEEEEVFEDDLVMEQQHGQANSNGSETEETDEQLQVAKNMVAHFMNPLVIEMQDLIIKANSPFEQGSTIDKPLGESMLHQVSVVVVDPFGSIKSSLSANDTARLQQIFEQVGKQTFKRPHVSVDTLVIISRWLKEARVKEQSTLWITFYKLLNRARSSVSKRKRQDKVDAMETQRALVQRLEQLSRGVRLLVNKTLPNIYEALDAAHQLIFMRSYLDSLNYVDSIIAEQYAEYVRREQALQNDEVGTTSVQSQQQQQQQPKPDNFIDVLVAEALAGADDDDENRVQREWNHM
eukprot:CAMPEP_0184700818 /NCGR_PEP_ID=MMETSP0313-20130426/16250_1 /TAXON_ID=2792 /ORGANISM="Porphyridium aerugineum, Strain SAG 1380-2" /LENGTH=370 /DNA_ID=CAMNT_0027160645 /DNA_START=365 /DNA_END=1477 /DNA_ORIENTATION=+